MNAKTQLELPLWLVLELTKGRQPVVKAELPKIFRETYREILKADANAVDLHKFSLNFYEFGSYVKRFDRKGEVHEILLQVSRFLQTNREYSVCFSVSGTDFDSCWI